MSKKFNPYEILGVEKNADKKTIEKKFKKLAISLHPDKNKNDPNANENFQQLTKAKDILINDDAKIKYDKYGITDEQDEIKINNQMYQEMRIKQRLKDVVQIDITLLQALNGFKRKLNLQREVINSVQRTQKMEHIEINLDFKTKPLNKPIICEGKGKKYDDLIGDLFIVINITPDPVYKINKSNFNLITRQKISIEQSLCGFNILLPYFGKNITIQYDKLINPNNIYIIKGMGLNISDESNILSKSDIEIHFDIQYQQQLTSEQIDKLKNIFNYNYTHNISNNEHKIYNIIEHKIAHTSNNNEHSDILNKMFREKGMMPGMMPGMMSGMSEMSGVDENGKECHVQ